jgi:hypothetical protein
MKTRTALCVSIAMILFVLAPPVRAEDQAADNNPLNQLAWMIGGKWKAGGEKGPDGKPFHVEWSSHWGDNHRTIKFSAWFLKEGKLVPVYDGLYAWHPAKKRFVFLYTDNQGNLTEGEAVANGDHLEQHFQIVGTDGNARPFRSTIVRRGPDEYDWTVLHEKDGKWEVLLGLKYKRSRE